MKLKLCFFLFVSSIIFLPVHLTAVPALSFYEEVCAQPSGESFKIKRFGDEFFNWTTSLAGDIVVKAQNGYWYYAVIKSNKLTIGSRRYLIDNKPASTVTQDQAFCLYKKRKSELISSSILSADYNLAPIESENALTDSPNAPIVRTKKLLVLLVEFNQTLIKFSDDQWYARIFDQNSKSLANYYKEVSYNNLLIIPAEENFNNSDGVVKSTLSYSHPNPGTAVDERNQQLVKDGLTEADKYIDFSSFDTDNDGYVTSDELIILAVIAGNEAVITTQAPGVWAHSGPIRNLTLDGKKITNKTNQPRYAQIGEMHYNQQASIGFACHEVGHALGLPDLYDTDQSSMGVGFHSLMSYGSWCREVGEQNGATPAHLDPWSKIKLMFITPTEVKNSGTYKLNSFSTGYNILKIPTVDPNQYFLLENRQFEGYDAGLDLFCKNPGVAIWHIDEKVTGTNFFNVNDDENHKKVDLEEANEGYRNYSQLDSWRDYGVPYDHYFSKEGVSSSFTPDSKPNSRLYNGEDTKISVDIGCLSSSMNAVISVSANTATPSPTLSPTPTIRDTLTPIPTPVSTQQYPLDQPVVNLIFYNGNLNYYNSTIYPRFKLTNTGTIPINLSNTVMRYYFTIDGGHSQSFWCDYFTFGSYKVTGKFVKMEVPAITADYYLEIGFDSTAGQLSPGQSIEVHVRFAKPDSWLSYNQTNDYSYNPNDSYYNDWSKVTVYIANIPQFGIAP